MNIQQLKSFCEVVRQGMSVSAAASVLHTSQPGVSRQLRELEETLGVKLLVRTRNRIVALTEPGKMLVEVARSIVADAERMRLIGQDFSESGNGSLSIATTHAHACYSLPPVVKAFGGRNPGIQLSLLQGNPRQCGTFVIDSTADLGIAAEIENPPAELVVLRAYRMRRSLIAPKGHPILRKRSLSLQEIARYPLVTYDRAFGVQAMLHSAFASQHIRPNIVLRAIDADVIKTYVELGLGVAVVATFVYHPDRDPGVGARDVTALFEPGYVNVYVRRGAYLRSCTLDFIASFAPHLKRELVIGAVSDPGAAPTGGSGVPML